MTLAYRHLAPKSDTGAMAVAGRRLRVYAIYCAYEMGESAELIAKKAEIPLPAVFEALAYAYDHPDEMDEIRKSDEEAEEYSLGLLHHDLRQVAEETMKRDESEYQRARKKARAARLGSALS